MRAPRWLGLIALVPTAPSLAALSCSTLESSAQVVSINEIRTSGSNPDSSLPAEFVELYFHQAASASGWRLCRDKNPSPQCLNVPNGSYSAGQFLVISSNLGLNASGDEVALCDSSGGSSCASGGMLDHVYYSNTSCGSEEWDVAGPPSNCDNACIIVSSSLKDIARVPDGSSSWENTNNNTAGSSNDGDDDAELDHIRLLHDGNGITCNAETVTLRACADSSCSTLFEDSVTVTPSATAGIGASYTPSSITFSGGQATVSLRATAAGSTTLGASASSPNAVNSSRCFLTTSGAESCSMSFAASGFLVSVPDHVSASDQTVSIAAVRTDDTTQQCIPAFADVDRTLNLYTSYIDPPTGSLASTINSTSIAISAPGTALSLSFNASGVASASLNYPDVGELGLTVTYSGSAGSGDAGLTMTGGDDFVAKPADFLLSIAGNPGASDPTGTVFRRAGQPFTIAVTARNALGDATPNFGQEVLPQSAQLEAALVAPAAGNVVEVVASSGFGAFTAGVASGDWVWDEVGAITLTPRLGSGDYLGAGDVVGTVSGTIGRFVPGWLEVSANLPVLQPACGSFSYQGASFGFSTAPSFTVSGRSLSAGTPITSNYDGDYWRLPGSLSERSYVSTAAATAATLDHSVDGGAALLSGSTAPPFDGSASLAVLGDQLSYLKTTAAEAAFDAEIGLQLSAADLTDLDGICHDPDRDGSCDGFTVAGIEGTELRWGRVAADNAFGPELFDLQVPLRAEYFDGVVFVPNSADSCSTLSAITLVDANAADSLSLADTCVLDSGQPGASGVGCSTPASPARQYTGSASSGQFVLWLQAPGSGRAGELDLIVQLPDWLRFDWRGSGASDPTVRIGFGVFAGDRRQIYTREVY